MIVEFPGKRVLQVSSAGTTAPRMNRAWDYDCVERLAGLDCSTTEFALVLGCTIAEVESAMTDDPRFQAAVQGAITGRATGEEIRATRQQVSNAGRAAGTFVQSLGLAYDRYPVLMRTLDPASLALSAFIAGAIHGVSEALGIDQCYWSLAEASHALGSADGEFARAARTVARVRRAAADTELAGFYQAGRWDSRRWLSGVRDGNALPI